MAVDPTDRPPDRSVRGVYSHQVAVLPVPTNTFAPGLWWAATTSVPLHFHLFNSCDGARGSANMPIPTEPSSTNGRAHLLQPKQGTELRGRHSVVTVEKM